MFIMKFNDYWKLPKDAKKYFSPKQEKKLKEKYGILYTLHTILSVVIVIAPIIVFFLNMPENALNPTTQTSNLLGAVGGMVGMVGSALIGLGLVNVFMIFVKQYLGHLVTLITITIGVILYYLSLFIFSFVN